MVDLADVRQLTDECGHNVHFSRLVVESDEIVKSDAQRHPGRSVPDFIDGERRFDEVAGPRPVCAKCNPTGITLADWSAKTTLY